MYRGTTPTITINCDVNVAEFVALWVTFKTTKRPTYADPKAVAFTGSYNDLSDTPSIPSTAADVGAIPTTEKGAKGGVAELDTDGKVPAAQLPSYVDDVIDTYIVSGADPFSAGWLSDKDGGAAITPESGKIYIVLTAGDYNMKTYRWSGSVYAVIGNDLALGETSTTAFRGDRGKAAYEHSQSTHAPANAQKNVQSDWDETDSSSDAFILHKPTIPAAVTRTVKSQTTASATHTVTGYILGVILIDSVTKEQVMGDITYTKATATVNNSVSVSFTAAPSNPILVVITSIA